ncbi:MAG: sodium:solute symporter family protein [Elusimicrobiota bacterium]
MQALGALDYAIIGVYVLISLAIGLYYTKKASESVENFFVSGRSLPWYLIGISMAATNFSIDTPLSIMGLVAEEGIAGLWFHWSNGITVMMSAFLFARLWRRARVITDAEVVELRYGGGPAAGLRLFKGFYFGVVLNCYILGWVFLALIKVMRGVTTLDVHWILVIFTAIVLIYTLCSGFYGVVMTDFFQYFIALGGTIVFAFLALKDVGGVSVLMEKIDSIYGAGAGLLNFVPDVDSPGQRMTFPVFLVFIFVQWWAHKYADGGGKHIQRMSAAKDETHATAGTFLFAFLNYSFQIWPWIVIALCAMVSFHGVPAFQADPEMGYSMMMAKVLPTGLLGVVVVTLIGAFMSTIDTHLNLGAAYMVNDMYRRFIKKDASEKHYILMSRLAMILNLAIAIVLALNMKSIADAWKNIIVFAAGAGLTWIIRWFWWRANAWTEFSGMIASSVIACYLFIFYPEMPYAYKLLIVVPASAAVWLSVTFLTRPVDENILVEFVRRVRPGSPGWNYIYRRHGLRPSGFFGEAMVNFALGLVFMFSLNFGIGSLIFKDTAQGLAMVAAGIVCFVVLIFRIMKAGAAEEESGRAAPSGGMG